ncbi:MAG: DUF3784 domain-containing protein [Bacteroidales bacterium]|nr:DUF3784 domain-containing protein [Bacteroidales bacterium]
MTVTIIIAAILVIPGIVILIGKGDNLIAGYNTASESEKKEINVKRLRLVIGSLLVIMGILYFLTMRESSMTSILAFAFTSSVFVIIALVLANTWAKKK